jgi:hypothetical protein
MSLISLDAKRKPVRYTIDVTHYYDGIIEVFVRDVSDDPRSCEIVMSTIISWAAKHMKAEHIHRAMLNRIDTLMNAEAGTPEGSELSDLATACQAYEDACMGVELTPSQETSE